MYFRIPLPTPFAVGEVNAYALRDGKRLVLVDTGPDTEEAWRALVEALADKGYTLADVHTVLLTHGHEDHAGLAYRLKGRYGATLVIHRQEIPELSPDPHERLRSSRLLHELLIRHGAPRDVVDHEPPGQARGPQNWRVEADRTFDKDETLVFDAIRMRAIHTPGHTLGSACFYHEASGLVFSGDHLIPGVVPNPGIQFPDGTLEGRTKGLPNYLASLTKLRALAVTRVCPGHREESTDPDRAIDQLVGYFERGQRRVLRLLAKGGLQAYDLAPPIGDPKQRTELFLFMFRNIGYLDLLCTQGLAAEHTTSGQVYFTAAGESLGLEPQP